MVTAGEALLLIMGGALAVEGALWAIVPAVMRKTYTDAFTMGDRFLHLSGLVSVALGVVCIAFAMQP